jgi:uncharacterized protein (TIGR03032 family)
MRFWKQKSNRNCRSLKMSDSTSEALQTVHAVEATPVEILSQQSSKLGEILSDLGISLVISTYQAGKLILARSEGESVNTHFRDCRKPMGVAVLGEQMAVGALGEILFYQNVPSNVPKLAQPEKHDACYMQRYSHITGDIDIHEMAFGYDGQIWFINTRFSALCTLHGSTSFRPAWRPSFVSAYAAEDRCHLNGLGLVDGLPRYVTALGESDVKGGWRENKADGGVLIDIVDGRTICRGLSMPHSPRWHDGRLWVCESGKGTLSTVDVLTGQLQVVFEFPGFTRGLDFVGPFAFVGLSQIRETATFSGIPIAEKADERNCGIWIVDTRDSTLIGFLRFTQGVQEIFAVQALHGKRYPELLPKDDRLALESYFLPPEVLNQVINR